MDLILFAAIGFLLKIIDSGVDSRVLSSRLIYFLAGSATGLWIYLMTTSNYASTLLFGVLFGSLLGGKVDHNVFKISSALILLSSFFMNIEVNIPMLIFLTVLAAADELLHEKSEMFALRPLMKAGVLLLYLAGTLPYTWALAFFAFDLSYDLTAFLISDRRKWLEACAWR